LTFGSSHSIAAIVAEIYDTGDAFLVGDDQYAHLSKTDLRDEG